MASFYWYSRANGVAAWDSGTSYNTGDTVLYSGYLYTSLTDSNTGNEPDTDTTDWAPAVGVNQSTPGLADEWQDQTNWWQDAGHTLGAGTIPSDFDSVYYIGAREPINVPSNRFAAFDTSGMDIGSTVANTATVMIDFGGNLTLGVAGDPTSIHTWLGTSASNATLTFQGGAQNHGDISQATFIDSASNQSDISQAAFFESASNQASCAIGSFLGNSNNSYSVARAIFYDSADNAGSVAFGTLYNSASNSGEIANLAVFPVASKVVPVSAGGPATWGFHEEFGPGTATGGSGVAAQVNTIYTSDSGTPVPHAGPGGLDSSGQFVPAPFIMALNGVNQGTSGALGTDGNAYDMDHVTTDVPGGNYYPPNDNVSPYTEDPSLVLTTGFYGVSNTTQGTGSGGGGGLTTTEHGWLATLVDVLARTNVLVDNGDGTVTATFSGGTAITYNKTTGQRTASSAEGS